MSTKPSIFERQLLQNAIAQLETDGLTIVPADMVNAVWQSFNGGRNNDVEVGVVGIDEEHNPERIDAYLHSMQAHAGWRSCWLRSPSVLAKKQAREVETIEIESDAECLELLKVYRTEGLEFADEAVLMGYIFKQKANNRSGLFMRLTDDEKCRFADLVRRNVLNKYLK